MSLEDWFHFDLYGKDEPVELTLERMVPVLKEYLV